MSLREIIAEPVEQHSWETLRPINELADTQSQACKFHTFRALQVEVKNLSLERFPSFAVVILPRTRPRELETGIQQLRGRLQLNDWVH